MVPTLAGIRKKGVPEQIVNLVEEMYNGSTTGVRTGCGVSAESPVTVGRHHGSARSPFLFVVYSGRDRREVT